LIHHQESLLQGGHLGKTAPCGIAKTYTTYEDHDLGDGGGGGVLWGGSTGFNCDILGHCTGKPQAGPLQLLGTDSKGCCCSPGNTGLGLPLTAIEWVGYPERYFECDSVLQKCLGASGTDACTPSSTAGICVPEVCQFELIETPEKGKVLAYKDDYTAGDILSNCTEHSPCVVPKRYSYEQPVTNNFVGAPGRFETNRLIFRPENGDVGACPFPKDPDCFGGAANFYNQRERQDSWRYGAIKFQIRTFTWMYIVPEGDLVKGGEDHKMLSKEFEGTRQNPFVENIEDAYQKMKMYNIWEPFSVQACPCRNWKVGYFCDGMAAFCEIDGRLGRLMIIDLKRMLGFDAGTAQICSCVAPTSTGDSTGVRCTGQTFCHTTEELKSMIAEVKNGCQSRSCFASLASQVGSTGVGYHLLRNQTGVSDPSQVWTRVIPYNDRPSVGGAGAALRFDGIDDLAAATVDIFPRDAFTLMFWIKGIQSERQNQGVLQFIAEDKGLQLQVYNSDNLQVFVLDQSSGPTGVNVNSDLEWHHVAVTWTRPGQFLYNGTYQGPGVVRLYVDCVLTQDSTEARSAQANAPGGRSAYACKHALNEEGYAWSGELSKNSSRMTAKGEISIGQRMACNATTIKRRRQYDRAIKLEHNASYCRRNVRHECDVAFNSTQSLHHPGIYAPESDCKKTVVGIYLSGGSENFSTCVVNKSDPYGAIVYGPIQRRMALDWSLSNDGDMTSGTTTSPYTIPEVNTRQSQNFRQLDCSSGCYRKEHALLGYMDELRVYNFTMDLREIAFRSRAGIRDGLNCDRIFVPQSMGVEPLQACSHMIDVTYKLGLMLYWPFDDPFPSYAADSTRTAGLYSGRLSLLSYDYASITTNRMGNFPSGLAYAMTLGAGRNATAPTRSPSTAPVFGARHDFILYPKGTVHMVEFKVGDVDTCINTEDILDEFSDSYFLHECHSTRCTDSHCANIAVQVQPIIMPGGTRCTPVCFGILLRPAVREKCQHPQSSGICAAYPECIGDLCFENSGSQFSTATFDVFRHYTFTGEYIDEGDLSVVGRFGRCQCDGGCTQSSFTMISSASGKASGTSGSYTGFTVKVQDGSRAEYRTVLCHGDRKCNPQEGNPLDGRTITLDRDLSFVPTTESTYSIIKGKYTAKWLAYYYSDLVGDSANSDRIIYDVVDMPGEAGTTYSKISPLASYQNLRFFSSLNPDAIDNREILRWNQPQMQGNIVIGSLGVPIPISYNVSIPEDSITLLSVDIILDDDNHATDFNLTVNGPQEYSLKQDGDFSKSGDLSGDLYQVLDVHCGVVQKGSKCVTLKDEQITFATGKNGLEEVTYCDDPTYVRSDSVMEQLKRSHELFNHGMISKVCTYNENGTEIYNVTGYNYSCLPPCSPTLYTYQILAEGCLENCTSRRNDLICDNTFGLYANQYACTGGAFHGQHCLGFDDVATCFTVEDQRAACQLRDLQPGIRGSNMKILLDKSDPSIMLHAIQTGDIHFIDWVHRGVQAVWSEVCTETAAALGYELILRYLITNGCPWRDTALEFAKTRGRVNIVQYLSSLRPPFGRVDQRCGCASLTLHEKTVGFRQCHPFSKSGLECYEKCGVEPTIDPSCQEGFSHYLAPGRDSSLTMATDMGQFLIPSIIPPALTTCSTGSQRALIRGPQMMFLNNNLDLGMRLFDGSYVGFSDKAIICEGNLAVQRGEAPQKNCKDPGTWPGFKNGNPIDFLNYHVSDKELRMLYFPAPGITGFAASFNYTVSRMSQHPRSNMGAPLEGRPVAARTGSVNIFVNPSNDYPDPKMQNASYLMPEDEISVLRLLWDDVDTARKDVRVYIKEFPKHGDLYQVVEARMTLNKTFGFNFSAHLLDPELCRTTSPDCRSGNCDLPKENCYYLSETFVIGEPIYREEIAMLQAPSAIYNTTRASIEPLPTRNATQCFETDRYSGLDMDKWAGEVFCELPYFDNIPSTCRRCQTVESTRQTLPPGAWSGKLLYDPIYTQRQDGTKALDAPNVLSQGGLCSLEEQCRLGGNTESKGSCIDWHRLAPDGRPVPYDERPMARVKGTANLWASWRWSLNHSNQPFPCSGATATGCTRNANYLWPGYFEPARITPVYPPQPLKDSTPPYQNVLLTQYGDPVDTESFYSLCKERDFHQFMAEYPQDVYMRGFDMHLSIPDGIFFRVLAWSSRFLSEDIYEMHEMDNVTRKVLEDRSDGPKTYVTYTSSKTKRMQRKRSVTKCAGEEWREVWRGQTQEGRPFKTFAESTQQGKDIDHLNLRIRFHPTNFTTKRLLLQSCGLMYQSAHNGDAGNPLDSFENLMLLGSYGSKPKSLVSEFVKNRVAYVPHPHYTGPDSFSFYGDEVQQYCEGRECLDRQHLKVGTVNITVVNTNDVPQSAWMEVTGGPGETIEFELTGVDASPDLSNGWIEWETLGLGAGQGSRGGIGPMGVVDSYPLGQSDFLGSPDSEPDDDLVVILDKLPELGTLTSIGGRKFRYVPPANGGGKPMAMLTFRLKDRQGAISLKSGTVYINYICQAGYYINQHVKKCSECPKGFYKPEKDDRTSCISCKVGTYAPRVALTACLHCEAGKYQPRVSSLNCLRCRIGHFVNASGAERCLACSPGTYAPRMNATSCLHCGTLSYAPLPAMFRCYDCPRLTWSSVTDSSDVANCKCTQGTYRNAIFNDSVNQLWSHDNLGVDNNSFVTPTVDIIKEPWPERLQLISSNCSACPDGSFCHGADLPPVAKIGYWTDWETEDKKFWENHVDSKFFKCDANNLREVCLGYPALDIQEQNEICQIRVNWGYCDDWPRNNYTVQPDAARCKAGYEDVTCSKCIGYELQQCVPKGSDPDDGWFSWKKFAKDRSYASFAREPFVDCYAIGACRPDDDSKICHSKRDMCKDNNDRCTWQTNRYYRAFDGTCSVCPLSVLAGFIFYLTWFAIFCAVIVVIIGLALTDMNSFSITITFWQSAALFARYRIPWPADAQSLLSLYSVANINLDGIPWMCFFNSAPGFRDIWFLTNLSIGGLVTASIVRWILPFLAVPPRGQVLIQQFKSALSRRDNLKGVGSVARVQYLQQRLNRTEIVRPSSVAPSQQSKRPSTAPSRPSTGGSKIGGGRRPTSALSATRSQGSARHAADIVIEEEFEIDAYHNGASFGSPFGPLRFKPRRPATLSEELASGPRSRASLIPSGSAEEEIGEELPGSIMSMSEPCRDKVTPGFGFEGDMILEEVPGDFAASVGLSSGVRTMHGPHTGSIRDRSYGTGAIRIAGGSFGVNFSKKKSATRALSSLTTRATGRATGGATENDYRPESAQDLIEAQDAESRALNGGTRDEVGAAAAQMDTSASNSTEHASRDNINRTDITDTKGEIADTTLKHKSAGSKLLSFSKSGPMSAMSKLRENIDKKSDKAESFETPAGGKEDTESVRNSTTDKVLPARPSVNDMKQRGAKMFSFAKAAGEAAAAKAVEQALKAKQKATKIAVESAAAAKEIRENPAALKAKIWQKKDMFAFLSPSKKASAGTDESMTEAAQGQAFSRPQSGSSARNQSGSALRPPQAPDVLVLEDIREFTAVSRPISAVSRPWSGASGISRPESAKRVSFPNTPSSSRPGTAPSRRRDNGQLDNISGRITPSRIQREKDGWREYRNDNPFQAHTPRMDQRLNSARSDGSSKEVPMDLGGIAWYIRKQYFDMAWRHAVAMLSILYICGCQKTLQALKWTWWTYSPVSKTAVLDCDPSVRIWDSNHGPVFPFALMALPVTVCGPMLNFFFLYGGYKLRALDDSSFSMRWGYLLDPFERKFWYWSIIVATRKFVLVFAQTFLRNSLYMQKFFPAVTICFNIILNYSMRPYRVERHNVYENILLVCLLFILLLGLISPLDIVVYHDALGRNMPGPYDTWIDIGILTIQCVALLISLVVIYADILDAQLRTPRLVKLLYLLTLGPIEMVLRIIRNIFELVFGTLWWLLGKIGITEKNKEPETQTSSAHRRKTKKKQSRFINPQALNRGSGDPPMVTGNRYADILWEKVNGQFRAKKKVEVNSLEDDYDELIRPDDGARWLRDKFSIRKRIFVLERRLQREALYDPKSTMILRMERQLTVALDAAGSQLKQERDAYFDQLYDAQTEYEAICIDRDVAQGKLDKQSEKLDVTLDASKYAQARLDVTIRRTGQPEDWKKLFLEQQVNL